MNRSDLESKVQVTWERCPRWPAAGMKKCVASLALRKEAVLDGLVERMSPCGPVSIRHEIGERLKRDLVSSVLGDLEAERARLRAVAEKWGRRAISRQFPSRERRNEQDGEEDELKEDLK